MSNVYRPTIVSVLGQASNPQPWARAGQENIHNRPVSHSCVVLVRGGQPDCFDSLYCKRISASEVLCDGPIGALARNLNVMLTCCRTPIAVFGAKCLKAEVRLYCVTSSTIKYERALLAFMHTWMTACKKNETRGSCTRASSAAQRLCIAAKRDKSKLKVC